MKDKIRDAFMIGLESVAIITAITTIVVMIVVSAKSYKANQIIKEYEKRGVTVCEDIPLR